LFNLVLLIHSSKTRTAPLDSLKETLRIFKIGLTIGLIGRESLVKWVKNRIAQEKKPAPELLDLTTLDPKSNPIITLNLLDKLIGSEGSDNAGKVVMRMIYDELTAGRISPVKAVQWAYHAATEARQTEAEQDYLSQLDDEGYLIQLGVGKRDEKEFEAEITTFLNQFKDYPLLF
jgi:hypothetical protein